MKKGIAILIIGLLLFGLFSCGDDGAAEQKSKEEVELLKSQLASLESEKIQLAKEKEDIKSQLEQIKVEMEQVTKANEQKTKPEEQKVKPDKEIYSIDDWWEVSDLWRLKIDSVKTTQDRYEYSEETPAEVVIITYTYENLGYVNDDSELYIYPETVIDSAKKVCNSYPLPNLNYAQGTPEGAICEGAQEAYGLTTDSGETITIYFYGYDYDYNRMKAEFEIPITR